MHMTEARSPARGAITIHSTSPDRIWFEGAAAPIFIVRGHRLASLYRHLRKRQISFIVPKIRKSGSARLGAAIAYLKNNEGRGAFP